MKKICFLFLLAVFAVHAEEERPIPLWELPRVWPRHNQLRQELVGALRRGDLRAMEAICRAALTIIPGDATWHYNLACALAYQKDPEPALTELERAITFGFRNADAISADADFARLKQLPRFAELLEKARALAGQPVPGRPTPGPRTVTIGSGFTLSETNLVWNFDSGLYEALIRFTPAKTPLALQAINYSKSKPTNPEVPLVRAWLSEGSAAGNAGDLYLNRDRGHSTIATGDFPQLGVVRYPKSAQATSADVDHPNTLFPCPVFGNISRGYTQGPYWRSMARFSMTEHGLAARMDALYRNNQFWIMPCVNDYGKPLLGDVFPGNAPFQFISLGASWSDQPFLRAALAASASFLQDTKAAILKRHLMGPTLQWLLRSTQKDVTSEADYLSAKAHPTAFASKRLDVVRLVKKAHALRPEQIPPTVSLDFINSRMFPVKYPQPLRDYPDLLSELVFASPSAIAFMLRAPAGERTFLFRARPFPTGTNDVTYTWCVVNGDPKRVKITAPLGESLNTPDRGFAQIVLDRRGLTNRLDVACFAKTKDSEWGAPAIISFSPVSLETRVYRPDGKIESIDYTNPSMTYCDPNLALPRNWKDVFTYKDDGTCRGYTRFVNGKAVSDFLPTGPRIAERAANGEPKKLVRVRYLPRRTGNDLQPLELTFTDDGEPYEVE